MASCTSAHIVSGHQWCLLTWETAARWIVTALDRKICPGWQSSPTSITERNTIFTKKHVSNTKYESLVDEVETIQTNSYYSLVWRANERESSGLLSTWLLEEILVWKWNQLSQNILVKRKGNSWDRKCGKVDNRKCKFCHVTPSKNNQTNLKIFGISKWTIKFARKDRNTVLRLNIVYK